MKKIKKKKIWKIDSMSKTQISDSIKQAIILIHNKDHAPVPHSVDYFEGLNILTRIVGWPTIHPHFKIDELGDLGCGYPGGH